jgi:adenylosuccinate lyase
VDRVEAALALSLGFSVAMGSVGQVYPRSLDFDVASALLLLASPAGNLALLVRLLAGHELATEGFREGQVGSSAMPHKMNTRSAERIGGMINVLRGHVTMAAGLVGDQWYEGDVSCSVVRRVLLPDVFLVSDGLLETTLEVVGDFGVYPAMIDEELRRYLPFLSTTRLLIAAVQRGLGRETAHELIRQHAVEAVNERRRHGSGTDDLLTRLGADDHFPFDEAELRRLVNEGPVPVGRAGEQVATFVGRVGRVVARHPDAASYRGGAVL